MSRFHLFRRRETKLSTTVQDEIQAMCTSQQIERLALSRHLRADLGLDCGCLDQPAHRLLLR